MADTRHTEQIISEELIERAARLGACTRGLDAARELIGHPIAELPSDCIAWAARLFDGRSCLPDGTEAWYRNGKLHREDGPAYTSRCGHQEWWLDGRLHREDGPAVVLSCGGEEWWFNNRPHREGGPAIIHPNGVFEWYRHGKHHRDDGPAIIRADGTEEWWRDGERVLALF
jgi:hypothetical protein